MEQANLNTSIEKPNDGPSAEDVCMKCEARWEENAAPWSKVEANFAVVKEGKRFCLLAHKWVCEACIDELFVPYDLVGGQVPLTPPDEPNTSSHGPALGVARQGDGNETDLDAMLASSWTAPKKGSSSSFNHA